MAGMIAAVRWLSTIFKMDPAIFATLAIRIFFLPRQENADAKSTFLNLRQQKMPMKNRPLSNFACKMVIYIGKMVTCLGKMIFLSYYYFLLLCNKLQ